ncbi:MAG TPA: hypothetical protein VF990_17080 [Candidatus Dormibacteraeota bacterium]
MTPPTRLSPVPAEIVDAFRAVAPAVEAFAQEQGLLIERYRRGKPAWELRFARRLGGEAVIAISYRERTGHVLDVSAVWWVDEAATQSRRLRSEKVAVYDRRAAPAALAEQLDRALAIVDGWTLDDLGPPHGPFKPALDEPAGRELRRR